MPFAVPQWAPAGDIASPPVDQRARCAARSALLAPHLAYALTLPAIRAEPIAATAGVAAFPAVVAIYFEVDATPPAACNRALAVQPYWDSFRRFVSLRVEELGDEHALLFGGELDGLCLVDDRPAERDRVGALLRALGTERAILDGAIGAHERPTRKRIGSLWMADYGRKGYRLAFRDRRDVRAKTKKRGSARLGCRDARISRAAIRASSGLGICTNITGHTVARACAIPVVVPTDLSARHAIGTGAGCTGPRRTRAAGVVSVVSSAACGCEDEKQNE